MATHLTFIATYIMASGRNGTLHVGMTANLFARVWKHKSRRLSRLHQRQGLHPPGLV